MESKMTKVCTRKIFYVFQDKLQHNLTCYSSYKEVDREIESYGVTCLVNDNGFIICVAYNITKSKFTCSCKLL